MENSQTTTVHYVKHRLTNEWTIEISNLFIRYKEATGDLVFTMKGKTVRLAIWSLKNRTREQWYADYKNQQSTRDEKDSPTLETFELSDEHVSMIGYMIEESDNQKSYKVIYGHSMVDGEVVDVALYFDNDNDKNWALETWKKIEIKSVEKT